MKDMKEVINKMKKIAELLVEKQDEREIILRFLEKSEKVLSLVNDEPKTSKTQVLPSNSGNRHELYKARRLKVIFENGDEIVLGNGGIRAGTLLRSLGYDYLEKQREARLNGKKTNIDPKLYLLRHYKEFGIKEIIPLE